MICLRSKCMVFGPFLSTIKTKKKKKTNQEKKLGQTEKTENETSDL